MLQIWPRRWIVSLFVIAMALAVASLTVRVLQYRFGQDPLAGLSPLFDLDHDSSIPSWFQSALLLVSAGLLALVAGRRRDLDAWDATRWTTLAALFAVAALDESASLHSRFVLPATLLGPHVLLRAWSWTVPAVIGLVALALWMKPLARELPTRTRRLVLVAAGLAVGGALGIEALSGLWAARHGLHNLGYHALVTLEELLETCGEVTFVAAWLDLLHRMGVTVIRVEPLGAIPGTEPDTLVREADEPVERVASA